MTDTHDFSPLGAEYGGNVLPEIKDQKEAILSDLQHVVESSNPNEFANRIINNTTPEEVQQNIMSAIPQLVNVDSQEVVIDQSDKSQLEAIRSALSVEGATPSFMHIIFKRDGTPEKNPNTVVICGTFPDNRCIFFAGRRPKPYQFMGNSNTTPIS
jgi:hypothetical protein